MSCAQNDFMRAGGRWFGFCFSSLLAALSWFCLMQDFPGGFLFSLVAIIILLLSLFRAGVWIMPVRLCLVMIDMFFVFVLSIFLFCTYFFVISPMGLLVGVFESEFFFRERLHRSRKYRHKSPGSYWAVR